jgi:phosphoribosylamine--glycine ligase
VGDGDQGPNTGGMGAFSPTTKVTPEVAREVEERVLLPALRELARRGRPFRGALYAGIMLTPRGLRVLEFNARFGDPETQPLMMRLAGDVVPVLLGAARGDLSGVQLDVDPGVAVGVVLASEGYPAKPATGDAIEGADGPFQDGVQVFHAGTALGSDDRLVSAGGRVLTVCARGDDLAAARERAYAALARIRLRGGHYRKAIGLK